MESAKYIDLFSTKGIEYILIILFLGLFIIFWRYLTSIKSGNISVNQSNLLVKGDWFKVVKEYFYHFGHSWARPEKENIVRVGMGDFAQALIGKVDKINLPAIGTNLRQGDVGWTLKSDSKEIKMLSPVGGEVVAVNEMVVNSPRVINESPYVNGWLFKVKTEHARENIKNLMPGEMAECWLEKLQQTISTDLSGNYGYILQDGGSIVPGFAKELDKEQWDKIAAKFFLTDDTI